MYITFLLILIFNCLSPSANTQGQYVAPGQETVQDNNPLKSVHLNRERLQKHRAEEDFNYLRIKKPDNWWDEFTDWVSEVWTEFWRNLFDVPEEAEGIGNVFTVLKYIIIAIVVALIIYLFIRLNPGNTVLKEGKKSRVYLSEEEKIIRQEDIPTLIEKAVANADYRLALRYSYLLILKELDQGRFIKFEVQKTNTDYLKELKGTSVFVPFKKITQLYDFTWYGGFDLKYNRYQKADLEVREIQSALKPHAHE